MRNLMKGTDEGKRSISPDNDKYKSIFDDYEQSIIKEIEISPKSKIVRQEHVKNSFKNFLSTFIEIGQPPCAYDLS